MAPGETLLYKIYLANPSSNTATGNFNLQVSPPEHLTVTQVVGGACTTNPCRYGGTVYYNSLSLAAGQSTILFFVATVDNSVANPAPTDDTVLTADLSASIGGSTISASTDVTVQTTHVASLAVEGSPDRVVPGGTLTYKIGYGNASNTPVAGQLKVALPAGTTFVSASGDGTASGTTASWDLGTIAAGYNDKRTLTVQVDAAAAPGSWLVADAQIVDSTSTQTLARASTADLVTSQSLLSFSMIASPDPVLPGQTIVYTLRVANQSSNTATESFNINVTAPPYMTVTAVPGGACTTNPCRYGGIIYYNGVSLAAGASTVLSFTATIDNSTTNPPPPSGAVIGNEAIAYVFGGVTANASVLVGNGKSLQVAIEGAPDRVAPGGTLTYKIGYGNAGNTPVAGQLKVALPVGTTFVSASGGGTASGGVVTWDLGSIAAGYNDQRTLSVQVATAAAPGGWLVADAQITDPTTGQTLVRDSTGDLVASQSPLSFSMSASPDPVLAGETIVYTLHVANQSSNTATDAFNINVTAPPYMTVTAVPGGACTTNPCRYGGIIYYNGVSLAAGASTVLSFTATIDNSTTNPPPPSGAVIGNEAIAYVFGGVTANASVLVGNGKNLQLLIQGAPDRVAPGGELTYEIGYGNVGNASVAGQLKVALPPGTTFVSASGGGTASGGVATWDLGSIAAGYNDKRTLTVKVDAAATPGAWLVADAQIDDPTSSQTLVRDTTEDLVASQSLLSFSMTGSPDPVLAGETIVYTLHVANESSNTATGDFNINVTVPPHMTATAVPGGACTTNPCRYGGIIYYNGVSLAAGASTVLSFTATVDNSTTNPPPPSGAVLGNDAIAFVFGGVTTNTSVFVGNGKSLQLAVQGVPDRVAPGGALTYTVSYGNASNGPVAAHLSVVLPTGVTFVSASDGGAASGSAVSWDLGTIPAGSNGQRTLNVQVDAAAVPGSWLVTDAQLIDPSSGQTLVRDSTADLVASQTLLTLTMSPLPNPAVPGQTVVYTLHVANDSANTATGNFNINVTVPPYMMVTQVPGGACTGNPCRYGSLIYYNGVSLAAGANTVLSFTATVDNSTTYPPPPVAEILTNEAMAYVFGTITVESSVTVGGTVATTPDAGVPVTDAAIRDAAVDLPLGTDLLIADAGKQDATIIDSTGRDAGVADDPIINAGSIDVMASVDAAPSSDAPAPVKLDAGGAPVVDGGIVAVDALATSDSKNDAGTTAIDAARVADAAKGTGNDSSGGCSCALARPGKTSFGPMALGLLALALIGRRRQSRSRTKV